MKFKLRQRGANIVSSAKEKAKIAIMLFAGAITIFSGNIKTKADTVAYIGKLQMINHVGDFSFCYVSFSMWHWPEGTEGYDSSWDMRYIPAGIMFCPDGKSMKIVSIVPGYELRSDVRHFESLTPVNLELALHTQWEGPLTFSNLTNELRCSFPWAEKYGWDFGTKPITLWKRDPNDPNFLSFIADIREACAKQGGTGLFLYLI